MSSGDITRYVITVNIHEASLTELNELNNAFTRANCLLPRTADEEVHALASSLAESVTDKDADIEVDTWESWRKK